MHITEKFLHFKKRENCIYLMLQKFAVVNVKEKINFHVKNCLNLKNVYYGWHSRAEVKFNFINVFHLKTIFL